MISFRLFLLAQLLAFSGLLSPSLPARDASCNYLAGQVVFQDTLYGLAIGTLMGGLSALAREDEPKYQKPLATGALAGSVLGLGFGVFEVAKRDCQLVEAPHEANQFPTSLVQLRPLPANDWATVGWQLNLSLRF